MSMPTGEKRDVVDNRAERISDLRAFLDMLESEPSLPVPPMFSAAAYLPRTPTNELQRVEEVFAAAEKLGTEVRYNLREGRIETTWTRGSVHYTVYTRLARPEPDKTRDVVTVTSPAQVLPTAAALAQLPLRSGDQFPVDRAEAAGEVLDERMTGTGGEVPLAPYRTDGGPS